jgi:4,5-DOPA dioxygenase extradiol
MRRRNMLELLMGSAIAAACTRTEEKAHPMTNATNTGSSRPMPTIFLAHGSPFLLDDAKWMAELAAWAGALPKPRAILMLSAHWVDEPITLGATRRVPLVYDFYGFPQRYYDVTYAAPGAPELAARAKSLLEATGRVRQSERGLDHGAYVPLLAMYPKADVPVLQVSLPTLDPKTLVAMGRALAPLRDEGVLIVGSGFLTHNMRTLDTTSGAAPPSWASDFDAWSAEAFAKRDVDALVDYRARAPGVGMALPTHEHFVPALVAMGAAPGSGQVRFPISGFTYGSFTKRSIEWSA